MSAASIPDDDSAAASEDRESAVKDATNGPRLLITSEGNLDPSLLIRTEGWVFKKGGAVNTSAFGGGRRNWKKRWFVLAPIEYRGHTGYELQYYDTRNGLLKGNVGLTDVEIFCEARTRQKKARYEFQVLLQNGNTLQLACENDTEREEWIETLNMVIAYLRKLASSSLIGLDGYDPSMEDDEDTFVRGDEIAQNCKAFGSGLFGAEAGQPGKFIVQVHDLGGNPVTRGGMPVTATVSNDQTLYYLRVTDNEDGTYAAHYVLTQPGLYQLHIQLNDEHDIYGSPFELSVMPSRTVSENCDASGEALAKVSAGSMGTFTITARDAFGNAKQRGGEPFEVGVMGPAELQSLRDNGDGTYTCQFAAQTPSQMSYFTGSSLMILVTLHGRHIRGSPFHPQIVESDGQPIRIRSDPKHQQITAAAPSSSLLGHYAEDPTNYANNNNISNRDSRTPSVRSNTSQSQPPHVISTSGAPQASRKGHKSATAPSHRSVEGPQTLVAAPESRAPRNAPMSVNELQSEPLAGAHAAVSTVSPTPEEKPNGKTKPISTAMNAAGIDRASRDLFSKTAQSKHQQQQQQQQQQQKGAMNATTVSTGSESAPQAGLSKLERARQRALLAKTMAEAPHTSDSVPPPPSFSRTLEGELRGQQPFEQNRPFQQDNRFPANNNNNIANNISANNGSENAAGNNNMNDIASKLSKLEAINRNTSGAILAGSSKLSNLGARAEATRTAIAASSSHIAGRSRDQNSAAQAKTSFFDPVSVAAELKRGLVGPQPPTLTPEEQSFWALAQQTTTSPETISILAPHFTALRAAYDLLAEKIEGVTVLRLTNPTHGGMARLLEEFDVIPAYLSKKEAKMTFFVVLSAQRNAGSVASTVAGGSGLDFPSFLRLLVLIAVHSLSKTSTFSSLYSTIEAKLDVMLHKWGFADPIRQQVVRSKIQ